MPMDILAEKKTGMLSAARWISSNSSGVWPVVATTKGSFAFYRISGHLADGPVEREINNPSAGPR